MTGILYNRIKKNFKKLSAWANVSHVDAFRLYDRDIPEIPYIIDYYSQHLVIWEKGKKSDQFDPSLKEKNINEIYSALKTLFAIEDDQIFFKERKRQQGIEQYEKISTQTKELTIQEHEAKFIVNLTDYLDTGLFLDHRPIRKQIYKMAKNKKFLNLFSYTCSVSICAALGGAQTTSVDLSNTYINWGKRNFELNELSLRKHDFIVSDCLKFLETNTEKFDIIFIDPPSFSNSKKFAGVFDVQEAHVGLIHRSSRILNAGGTIFFSTNLRDFKMDPALSEKFKIKDITKSSIPQDFRDQKIHKCFEITKLPRS